jgi:hypothetical protein
MNRSITKSWGRWLLGVNNSNVQSCPISQLLLVRGALHIYRRSLKFLSEKKGSFGF